MGNKLYASVLKKAFFGAIVALLAIAGNTGLHEPRAASAAAGDIAAVFGTVLKVDPPVISLATDNAVLKMSVNSATTIKLGEVPATVNDIAVGDRIAATAIEQAGGVLLAQSILVRPRDGIQVRHLVGIVIASGDGKATVLDRDRNSVTFFLPPGVALPALGDAITVVTRRDPISGRTEAQATERAQNVIDRIANQLDILQDQLEVEAIEKAVRLRELLQEDTQKHLSALAEAAGKVKSNDGRVSEKVRDGAAELLEAARARYAESAAKHGVEIGDIQVEGTIAAVFEASVTLRLRGGGEVDFAIDGKTRIMVDGSENATVADLDVGMYAVVGFDPEGDPNAPVARKIKASEPKLGSDIAANLEISGLAQFDGVISHVELETALDDIKAVVIVVNDDRGARVVVKAAVDTEITVNGVATTAASLKPGLRATVSLREGLVARSIRAYSPDEGQRAIEGEIRKVDIENGVVLIAPAKGQPVAVSLGNESKIERDGHAAGLADVQVNDLVLGGSRYHKATGEIVRLVLRSPRLTIEGSISGISLEEHAVSLRPRNGDPVRLLVVNETEIYVKGGEPLKFSDLKPGLQVVASWRAALIDGVVRNQATSIVVIRSEFETVKGVVAKVDAGAGALVIETDAGVLVEVHLPGGDRKASLVKNGRSIDSLRPVEPGDEVHKAAYVADRGTLTSLVVVTPAAVNVRGQLTGVDPVAGVIKLAIGKDKTLSLAITARSVFTFQGEAVPLDRIAGHPRVALVALYVVKGAPAGTDGTLLTAEVVILGEPEKPVAAPTPVRVETVVTGVVRVIEGDVWVINDVKFKVVRGTTKIDGKGVVGAVAKANLVGERGGELIATQIFVREAPQAVATATPKPAPAKTPDATPQVTVITGTIQRIDGDIWIVRDTAFVRTARTVVKGEIRVGAAVKMVVRKADDGSIVIVEATVAAVDGTGGPNAGDKPPVTATPAAADEQTLDGKIEKVDGDVLVINGLRVLVVPHVLERREVGLRIKCVVKRTERAVLEAVRCVVVTQPEKTPTPVVAVPVFKTVTGLLTSIDTAARVLVIDGVKYAVAGDARIDGRPAAGARVKALVRVDGNTLVVVAATIYVEASATGTTVKPTAVPVSTITIVKTPQAEIRTLTGVISAIDGRVWVVDGRKLLLTDASKVDGRPVVGAQAKVQVRIDGDTWTVLMAVVTAAPTVAPGATVRP
jgi:hypothetical protein